MRSVTIRFYGELRELLPPAGRDGTVRREFRGRVPAKDLVESLGVPHPEVALLLVGGASVPLDHRLEGGETVSVFPVFRRLDVSGVSRVPVAARPPSPGRFAVDRHLGKLARGLRLLGFDTLWQKDRAENELAEEAARQGRILLTRDRELLKRSRVRYGYLVRASHPDRQLDEVAERFLLLGKARPFRRCLCCNGRLVPVPAEQVAACIPPGVRQTCDDFTRCRECKRIFWKGTHYREMVRRYRHLFPGEAGPSGRRDSRASSYSGPRSNGF